ncbi:MAG: LemA family protein [bacterium]|nr:LemA family protein [bacterium]
MTLKIVIIAFVLIFLFVLFAYNTLVKWRMRVKEAFSQLDVQLKRRHDLIPNLVETVKGYMKHERELLERITELRSRAIKASDFKEKGEVEGSLTGSIKKLLVLVENYPDLKASENFKILQEEITSTENRIAYARQFFNDTVRHYNTLCQVFPTNIIANLFGFKPAEFLEFPEERGTVEIKF